MMFSTLIGTSDLATHLDDPSWVVIDCRFDLAQPAWGESEYRTAHVPGAAYAHLDRDLSGVKTDTNGRHPMPDWTTFAARAGGWGIGSGVQVVAYDQQNGMYASRLWWMLRYLGHDAVAVLDGSFRKWVAEARETGSGEETHAPRTFTPAPRREWLLTVEDVARRLGAPDQLLLDARAPERFAGQSETLDKVAGHIPGAKNYFFQRNLAPDATFLAPTELRAQLTAVVGDRDPSQIVCYCGSGVTACHNLLALEHAGLRGARLYAGSWSEWSADPARPVERGGAGL